MLKKNGIKAYNRLRGDSGQHRRILLVGLILGIVAFLPVLVRLYMLMVHQYDTYASRALQNQSRTTLVAGKRGTIYDVNMNILAADRSVETVYLNPHELKQAGEDVDAISSFLAEQLNLDPQWVRKQATDYSMRYKQVAAGVDTETTARLRAYINENNISGIHLEPGAERYYPCGTLAAQVIGFTNASNTGSEGIEAAYNSYLEGDPEKVIAIKGNHEIDMPFSYEKYVTSREGCSIILTLDTTVQACLEKQMETAIARYDVQNGAFGMVMNVNTGEILAMATLSSYDPNDYQQITDEDTRRELAELQLQYRLHPEASPEYEQGKQKYLNALQTAQLKQWRNRCISDGYEPGSTFKVMTMAAALDCGAIDLQTGFHCSGTERIPGRSQLLHCWRSTGHGAEQTPQALQNSCNIAFAHIALKLGGERFYEYVERFGVLEETGIDLNGESKGIFFDRKLVTDTDKWGTASLTSGSFGQTFKLTPLQLVRGIASVVNGGYLLEPYIVSEVIDADGNTVLKQEPTVLRRTISEETSRTMCDLIRSVVEEGTAKNASIPGYAIGGKTGTSEKIDVLDENGQRVLDKIVSFVGVAPMDDPEYIVLVALDTPSRTTGVYISGGVMAAPTVGAVMGDILPYLGVRHSYSDSDAAGRKVILQDMTGMTALQAEQYLEKEGLSFVATGDGLTVTGQIPAAGQGIPGDSQVLLYFGQNPSRRIISVPDFRGMTRQQASDSAGLLGLYISVSGNTDITPNVVVTAQSVEKDTQVPVGTTIDLTFADIKAAD